MENDSTNEPVRQLSDLQEKVLAILPLPSALLSVLGSTIILFMALESRKSKQWTPYTRLLVGLSLSDILYSVSISIASFLRPKDSSNFVFAMGTDASCNAAGFLNQLGVSAFFYNAALSFYFLLTARFGVSAKQFSRRIEKVIHLIGIGHPILTASIGLSLDLYGESRGVMGCWLDFDKRCLSEDPEVRELANNCTLRYTSFIFYIIPALFTFISLIVNNLVISRFVHNKVKPSCNRKKVSQHSSSADFSLSSSASDGVVSNTMKTEEAVEEVASQSIISSSNKEMLAIQKAQYRRLKLVRSQAFLFVASYFLCHIWSLGMAVGDFLARCETTELQFLVKYYPVALLQAFFQPLQGMLNMLVFVRPKYLKARSDFPRETKWWAFKRAIFGDRIWPTSMDTPEKDEEEEVQSDHFVEENNDKNEDEYACDEMPAYSRIRENVSTMTASLGDFDHVIEDGVEDERWVSERSDTLTSWGPPARRSRQFTSSATLVRSNLEVISENSESIFDAFEDGVTTSNMKQHHVPSINPEQREGRWSPSDSPCTTPPGRSRPADDVLASRFQASFGTDSSSTTIPDSPASRWSSESKKPEAASSTATIALPRRAESLSDESSFSPLGNSPRSLAITLSPPLINSSGNSVATCTSSTDSLDAPLVPPRRKLSDPPFIVNESSFGSILNK